MRAIDERFFAQLGEAVADGDEVAVLAAHVSMITGSACVVLQRRGNRWAVEAATRIEIEPGRSRVGDHEIEPWLSATTGQEPWSGRTVYHGGDAVARVMVLDADLSDEFTTACTLAAPFLAARRRRQPSAGIVESTVAQIIHDLGQPISTLGLLLDVTASSKRFDPVVIDRARRAVGHLRELTADLLLLSSPQRRQQEVVPLAPLLADLVTEQTDRAARTDVEIVLEVRNPVRLIGARLALTRGIGNVLSNAVSFAPPSSQVRVILELTDRVVIEVRDQGPGVERDLRERVFEPFFSTRPGGHGLGLAVARRSAQQHGGVVRFVDGPGGIVRFEFPVQRAARDSARELPPTDVAITESVQSLAGNLPAHQ